MTDHANAASPDGAYRCPGEAYAISRSLHLARLSSFYRACRGCPHRFDRDLLSPRTVQQLSALERGADDSTAACLETLGGRHGADFQPQHARQLAAAFALWLREQNANRTNRVVLAFDGRPLQAEFVAQAAEGIRWAGCGLIDLGVATAPVLALAQAQHQADGALYLGSPAGEPFVVALKFWGPAGLPLSRQQAAAPEQSLEALEQLAAELPPRPVRQHGPLVRTAPGERHLTRLAQYYHALRPLRFVLDTASGPLRRSLQGLLANVACQAVEPWPEGTPRGNHLGEAVLREQAHFGIWIDGDGERLRLWDEQGRALAWHAVLAILTRHLLASRPWARVVVEQGGPAEAQLLMAFCLDSMNLRRIEAGPTRAEMVVALHGNQPVVGDAAASGRRHSATEVQLDAIPRTDPPAELGGGPSGRYWFCHRLDTDDDRAHRCVFLPDALEALTHLLVILSGSDRPLSAVAAESLALSRERGTV